MDSAACSNWRTLSDNTPWGKGAWKALKILRSVKKTQKSSRKTIKNFLSCRTSRLSEYHYFAGPFLPPLKILSLVQVRSQWFICIWTCSSGQTLGHRRKAMQRGISLEELLRISGYLMHFCVWRDWCSFFLSLPFMFSMLLLLAASGWWQRNKWALCSAWSHPHIEKEFGCKKVVIQILQ